MESISPWSTKRKRTDDEEDGAETHDFVSTTPAARRSGAEDEGESFGVGGLTLQGVLGSVQKVFSRRTVDNGREETRSIKKRRMSPSEAAGRLGLIVGENEGGLEQISGQSDSTASSTEGPTSGTVPSPPGSVFNRRILFGSGEESGTKAPPPSRRGLSHKQRSPVPRLDLSSPVNAGASNRDKGKEKEQCEKEDAPPRGSRVRFQESDSGTSLAGEVETGLLDRGSKSLTPFVERQPESSRRKGTPAPLSFRREVLFGQSNEGKGTEEIAASDGSDGEKAVVTDHKQDSPSNDALIPGTSADFASAARRYSTFRPGSHLELDNLSRLESRNAAGRFDPMWYNYRSRSRPWSAGLYQSAAARGKKRSAKTSKGFNARQAARIAEMASDTLFPSWPVETADPLFPLVPVRKSLVTSESAVTVTRTFGSNQSGTRLPLAPTLSRSPLTSSGIDGTTQPTPSRSSAPSVLRTSTETALPKSVAFAPGVAVTPKNLVTGQGGKMPRRSTPMFPRNGATSNSDSPLEDEENDAMETTPVFLGRSVPRDGEGRPTPTKPSEYLPQEVDQKDSRSIEKMDAFMKVNALVPAKGVPESLGVDFSHTPKQQRGVRFKEETVEDKTSTDVPVASSSATAIRSRIQTPHPKKAKEDNDEKEASPLPYSSFPRSHQAPSSSFKPRKDPEVRKVPLPSTSSSSPLASTTAPQTTAKTPPVGSLWEASMFGNPDDWKCDQCMVKNPKDATKCAACEAPKPGSSGHSQPAPTAKFNFGSSASTTGAYFGHGSSSIIFGEATAKTGRTLESQDEKKEGPEVILREDISPRQKSESSQMRAKTAPKLTFGTVVSKPEETPKPTVPSAGFKFRKEPGDDTAASGGSSFNGFVFDASSSKPNSTPQTQEKHELSSVPDGIASRVTVPESVTKPPWKDTSTVAEKSDRKKKKRTLDEPGLDPKSSNGGFTKENSSISAGKKFQFGSPTGNLPVPSADPSATSSGFAPFSAADSLTPKPTSESTPKLVFGGVVPASGGTPAPVAGTFPFGAATAAGSLVFSTSGAQSAATSDGRTSKRRINEQSIKSDLPDGTGQSKQMSLPPLPTGPDAKSAASTFSFGASKSTPSHSVNGSSAPASQGSADFSFGKQPSAAGTAAFTFGTTATAQPNPAAGSFGSSTSATPAPGSNFTFGTANPTPPPSTATPGFSFGSGAAPTTPAAQSTQGALFGGPVPPTTAPPSFSGGVTATAGGGSTGFSFGAGGSSGFGAGSGAGFSTPGPPSGGMGIGGGSFSIGTGGSSTGKTRRIVKARRPPSSSKAQ